MYLNHVNVDCYFSHKRICYFRPNSWDYYPGVRVVRYWNIFFSISLSISQPPSPTPHLTA